MAFKKGVKAAAELLQSIAPEKREGVIEKISLKDPEMAELLKKKLYTFSDIQYITPKMLVELLREVNIDDFARALKLASSEVKKFVFENISSNMKDDMIFIIEKPIAKSEVWASEEKVMNVIRSKADKGELVFSTGEDETYV